MRTTKAMRDRLRDLVVQPLDDYDRAVLKALDDLEELMLPCGECHIQPGERCDICGRKLPTRPK